MKIMALSNANILIRTYEPYCTTYGGQQTVKKSSKVRVLEAGRESKALAGL